MVEISLSGSGEGLGGVILRGYSTILRFEALEGPVVERTSPGTEPMTRLEG